jgi:hypothetical protein
MKVYKFLNKKERTRITWIASLTSIAAVLIFLNFDIGINQHLLYFITSLLSFIFIMRYLQKSRIEIEDLIVSNDSIKIYFHNKMKDSIQLDPKTTKINIENERVIFRNKNSIKPIGIAKRDAMEIQEQWSELINILTKFKNEFNDISGIK